MSTRLKVSFIGAGKMGQAMIRRLLETEKDFPVDLTVSDHTAETVHSLGSSHPEIRTTVDNSDCVSGADVVVLCVKPGHLPGVAKGIVANLRPGCLIVSILAGVGIQTLEETLGQKNVVRAMPNTPGQIGQGITGWCCSAELSVEHKVLAAQILRTLGQEVFFEDEKYLDIVTAVSGSGPGLIYLYMEAVEDAAVQMGMPRDIARRLITQTILGSGAYAQSRPKTNFAELRHEVTSPGGTTAIGVYVLDLERFRAAIIKAHIAMVEKCKALGQPKA